MPPIRSRPLPSQPLAMHVASGHLDHLRPRNLSSDARPSGHLDPTIKCRREVREGPQRHVAAPREELREIGPTAADPPCEFSLRDVLFLHALKDELGRLKD